MNCDGFCAAPAFPWWLMAAQVLAILALAWLAGRGWMHRPTARAAIRCLTATLTALTYVGNSRDAAFARVSRRFEVKFNLSRPPPGG
jgi:hypothetical protein